MLLVAHGIVAVRCFRAGERRAVLWWYEPGFGGKVFGLGGDVLPALRTDVECGQCAADEASGRCHPVARGVQFGGVGNECGTGNHGQVVDILEGLRAPFAAFAGDAVLQCGDALGPVAVGEGGVGEEIVRLPLCTLGDGERPKRAAVGAQADDVGNAVGRIAVEEFHTGILRQAVLEMIFPRRHRKGGEPEGQKQQDYEDEAHGRFADGGVRGKKKAPYCTGGRAAWGRSCLDAILGFYPTFLAKGGRLS